MNGKILRLLAVFMLLLGVVVPVGLVAANATGDHGDASDDLLYMSSDGATFEPGLFGVAMRSDDDDDDDDGDDGDDDDDDDDGDDDDDDKCSKDDDDDDNDGNTRFEEDDEDFGCEDDDDDGQSAPQTRSDGCAFTDERLNCDRDAPFVVYCAPDGFSVFVLTEAGSATEAFKATISEIVTARTLALATGEAQIVRAERGVTMVYFLSGEVQFSGGDPRGRVYIYTDDANTCGALPATLLTPIQPAEATEAGESGVPINNPLTLPNGQRVHVVQQGDTMLTIARLYDINLQTLVEANGDVLIVAPGDLVLLP